MSTKVYEGMFLLDSNRYARDPGGVSGQITQIVEKCGGEILASRLWNEQKLAYPIEGHRKGTYWLTYFRMDSGNLVSFNRECQLNEGVLRNLTLKVDPRLVEALVAHARGEAKETPEAPAAKEAESAPASEPEKKEAAAATEAK